MFFFDVRENVALQRINPSADRRCNCVCRRMSALFQRRPPHTSCGDGKNAQTPDSDRVYFAPPTATGGEDNKRATATTTRESRPLYTLPRHAVAAASVRLEVESRKKKTKKKKTTKIARDKCTRTVSPRTRTKRPVHELMRILFGVVYCKRKRGQLRAAVARTAFQQNTISPDENIYVHVFYFLFFPLLLFDFVRNFVCSSDRTSLSDGCARWTCSVELTWLDRTPVVESIR